MVADIRADYAPTQPVGSTTAAIIAAVEPDSPADRAGLLPDTVVLAVDNQPLRDILDWLWLTDDSELELTVVVDGIAKGMTLYRDFGEAWGISFVDPLFDGVRICRNKCIFCFMSMLPKDMRRALYVRDDDYRLSFLQGNFVTLTNMTDADVDRVKEYRLSPLHVSLHAVSPQVRERMIGKHQAQGLKVLDELLAAGIEVHAQVVLVPGYNDGAELDATLQWIEQRPGILSVGIVPYGYTRHAQLQASYGDPKDALAVLSQVEPYQQRARLRLGKTRFQPSDEFFCNAYPQAIADNLPAAELYDGYPQFEDGIGMLRVFADEWNAAVAADTEIIPETQEYPVPFTLICGTAFERFFKPLLEASPLEGRLVLLSIENRFFGGNIDVSGLLTATDICEQAAERIAQGSTVLLPQAMFNADDLTLDGCSVIDIEQCLGVPAIVVPCSVESLYAVLRQNLPLEP